MPVTIALTLSIPLGLLSGYAGGWVDGVIMRITDAMLAIPFLIVAIALVPLTASATTSRSGHSILATIAVGNEQRLGSIAASLAVVTVVFVVVR